ncbi:MAG: 4-hydroxy-2-oxoheptanedioate aldolase [Burkholderiales bacterium]|nr:4-hydroxy-2-oxoheptanedioate aldolase [Burkholderiales bacterium]MDE1928661.1 4-hydroxy-2-oxoheptanedioate aldolase [Burkholderiales bacterium]MDE2158537.1 4-hydroxy-2-oxoheptanedioate aldolase [Burkholderiales bacterium]MDE2503572.1 4-hydroxy-2-oxoheptanedioate aldolase [Burkholderiales bacterium]
MSRLPSNEFKRALREPGAQIGLWLALADPYAAELCASAGFDWLLVDGEHGPNDLRSMLASLQAIAPHPSHPVVRVPQGDTVLIKQVLEIGATTLLVPMVETAAQAAELVRAMRYPPQGVRGVGSGLARSSRWGLYGDYLQRANDEVCLLVQVESATALAQVARIAAVDGVDGVFIGPSDLSASMGLIGQPGHPEVRAAIETAIAAILAAGKAPGILAVEPVLAQRYIEIGCRYVAVGTEAVMLAQAARALAARFKRGPGGGPAPGGAPTRSGY